MPDLNDELGDNFEEESEDLVPYEDDPEQDDEELDDNEESPRRRQAQPDSRQQLATVNRELDEAKAKVDDLEGRLGNALRIHGERLKERDQEIDGWLERMQPFVDGQIAEAKAAGFIEGVKETERRLLPMLGSVEKGEYATDKSLNPPEPSSPRLVQLDTRRKTSSVSDTHSEINTLVQRYVAQGVPVDQLDQTSAESVVDSGVRYFKSLNVGLEDRLNSIESKLNGQQREERGATRVSSGNGGPGRPAVRMSLEKQLEEVETQIAHAKRTHNIKRGTDLLKRKSEIQQALRRRTAASV